MWSTALALVAVLIGANPRLEAARRANEAMDYPRAEAELRAAREEPGLSRTERREVLDLLALALAAQGRNTEAESVYLELLAQDPAAPVPEAAPKIRELYRSAKARLYPADLVRLSAVVQPGTLELSLVDPWQRVSAVTLHESEDGSDFRQRTLPVSKGALSVSAPTRGNDASTSGASTRTDGDHTSTSGVGTPADEDDAATVTVTESGVSVRWRDGGRWAWVEATDASDGRLAQAGSADAPLVVPPPPPSVAASQAPRDAVPSLELGTSASAQPPSPWPAVALAVTAGVAAGVGTWLAVASVNDYREAGLPSSSAVETRRLDRMARDKALASQLVFGGALLSGGASAFLFWRLP